MSLGDIAQGLSLLLVIFTVFYYWDTPKKPNRKVTEISSADIAKAMRRTSK